MAIKVRDKYLWNVGEPNLYDLQLSLYDGEEAQDEVSSYFGLRTIGFDGKSTSRHMINTTAGIKL